MKKVLVCALAGVLVAGAASAQERLRVLLVIDQANDRFAERIRAEVVGLGLEVVTLEPWRTGESIDSLASVGKGEQAAAAIRLVPSRKGVEIWMANQPTGRSLLRQLVVDESGDSPNEGLIALQTAELLRTSLLSVQDTGRRAAPKPAPSAAPEASTPSITAAPAAAPRPDRVGLEVGFGTLFSPGGGDPAMQLWASLHHFVSPRIGLALDFSAPLRLGEVSGPEGSARLGSHLVGAVVFVRFKAPPSRLYGALGAGAAGIRVIADGDAAAPFSAASQTVFTGAAYARADGGIEATRWLRFGLRAVAGATTSKVNVRFGGNEAATWGWPFLAGLLQAELVWP